MASFASACQPAHSLTHVKKFDIEPFLGTPDTVTPHSNPRKRRPLFANFPNNPIDKPFPFPLHHRHQMTNTDNAKNLRSAGPLVHVKTYRAKNARRSPVPCHVHGPRSSILALGFWRGSAPRCRRGKGWRRIVMAFGR